MTNYDESILEKLNELIELCEAAHLDPEYDGLSYMLSQLGPKKGKVKKPEKEGNGSTLLTLANILRDLKDQLEKAPDGEPYMFKLLVACDRRDPMGVEPFWATACLDKEVAEELMESDDEDYIGSKEIIRIPIQ